MQNVDLDGRNTRSLTAYGKSEVPRKGKVRSWLNGVCLLRKAEARSRETLLETIGAALSVITDQDAHGFFEHCGYRAMVQLF